MTPDEVVQHITEVHAPPAEFQRGPAGPDQQPYGAATAQNEAVAAIPDQPAPVEPVAPETPQTQAAPAPGPVSVMPEEFIPKTETEQHLFGPSQRPTEPLAPTPALSLADWGDWIPALADAAQRADATPQLKALFRIVVAGQH